MKHTIFGSVILLFCLIICHSCGNEDDSEVLEKLSLNKSEIQLNSLDEEDIIILPSSAGCTFRSENPYIASVSSDGKVRGITIGTTNIIATNSEMNFEAKCKVVVKPKFNIFKEPCLEFGLTKAQIKSRETRILSNEIGTAIAYKGENSYVDAIMYVFDDNGKLIAASFLAPAIPTSNIEKLMGFILERYFLLDYDMSKEIFMTGVSNDEKIGIGMQFYKTDIMGMYFPNSISKSNMNPSIYESIEKLIHNK